MPLFQKVVGFIPVLGAAAVILAAQLKVRERSDRAAMLMSVGPGVYVLVMLVRQFVQSELLWALAPVVTVGAIGSVVYGLFVLMEALHPRHGRPLPPLLAAGGPPHKPNLFIRGFFGFFGVMAIFAGFGRMGGGSGMVGVVLGVAALLGTLYGSWWVDKQGPAHRWVLEHKPELIIWTYVHQLTVVNRRYGTRTVHWSAQLGLSTGEKVGIPASGEQGAQALVGSVLQLRPGIIAGYSPENVARFVAQVNAGGAPK